MIKAAITFLAIAGAGATFAACGGVPGNAVATVDGESINKTDFSHWMTVAAKSAAADNAVPDPENDYKNCVAAKRKATPAPAKGQPKTTDAQLKTQCKTEYEQYRSQVLQLLISFKWIQGEAEAKNIKVTDAEVKKSFDEQKKQSFPKEADYKKFIKESGQTQEDIMQRVKLDLLSNKIRDKVVKGKDTVTDKQIADFYAKNKARFAQPEKRDLRVVLTKEKADADKALAALEGRRLVEDRRQEVLDRRRVQGRGRQARRAGQGHARQGARRRGVLGQEGRALRADQDPVRLLRLPGHGDHRRLPADAGRGQGDDQADARLPGPAEGAGLVREGLHEALEGEDRVQRQLQDQRLQERPEAHADPDGGDRHVIKRHSGRAHVPARPPLAYRVAPARSRISLCRSSSVGHVVALRPGPCRTRCRCPTRARRAPRRCARSGSRSCPRPGRRVVRDEREVELGVRRLQVAQRGEVVGVVGGLRDGERHEVDRRATPRRRRR